MVNTNAAVANPFNLTAYEVVYKLNQKARKTFTAIRFGSSAANIEGAVVLSVRELTEAEVTRLGR
jgi:hypothetical protein